MYLVPCYLACFRAVGRELLEHCRLWGFNPQGFFFLLAVMEMLACNSESISLHCLSEAALWLWTQSYSAADKAPFFTVWLLSLTMSVPGGWETHYSCCSGAVGSPGCQVAKVSYQERFLFNGNFPSFPPHGLSLSPLVHSLHCNCFSQRGICNLFTFINW